jgi:hypothetical protein
MNLKVFRGAKDIFRDNFPRVNSHQQDFKLTLGAVSPVPLYEFELRELFNEASVQSGCKWWLRYSRASEATVNLRHAATNLSFSEVQMIGKASCAVMCPRSLLRTAHLATLAMMTTMVARTQKMPQQSKSEQVLARKKRSRDGNKVVMLR